MDLVAIKDKPNLVRDIKSKALLNTDNSALERYEQQKRIFESAKQQMNEVAELRSEVNEIKELLLKLLEKK